MNGRVSDGIIVIHKLVKRHIAFLVDALVSVILVLSVATLIELLRLDKLLSKFDVLDFYFLHLRWTSLCLFGLSYLFALYLI